MRVHQRVLVIGVTIGLAVVASACGTSSAAPHETGGAIGTPTTVPDGPTLKGLTASVQSQITGTGSSGFSVTVVTKVVCNPHGSWKPAATFTCYAYDSSLTEIGEYDGTVEPDSGDRWQWNASWDPSPDYTPPAK